MSDYPELEDLYAPDEPAVPLYVAAAQLGVSERTLRRRLHKNPYAIHGYERNARGKKTPLVATKELDAGRARSRNRPRHIDFARICRVNGRDPFLTLKLLLAGAYPDIDLLHAAMHSILEPRVFGAREDRNEFLRLLYLPRKEREKVAGFDAVIAGAIRNKAGCIRLPKHSRKFSAEWRRARRNVWRDWYLFPSHPVFITDERLEKSELIHCPGYLARHHPRSLGLDDTIAPHWALASLLPTRRIMRDRAAQKAGITTMFPIIDGRPRAISGKQNELLNFALELAAQWQPRKTHWKTDFTAKAAPALTAFRKLNVPNKQAVKLVRAWQKRSQRNSPVRASIGTVNQAFMMSSRTL